MAAYYLKDQDLLSAEALLLKDFERVLGSNNRLLDAARTSRHAAQAEQANTNLLTSLYYSATNPSNFASMDTPTRKKQLFLRRTGKLSQNPNQPAGETIAVARNKYTFKFHEHAGSIMPEHLASRISNLDPWNQKVIDAVQTPGLLVPNNDSVSLAIGRLSNILHQKSLESGVLNKTYFDTHGAMDAAKVADQIGGKKRPDVPFFRPNKEVLAMNGEQIDDYLKSKLSSTISDFLNKPENTALKAQFNVEKNTIRISKPN